MSRIGKKPIKIPKDVTATLSGHNLVIKGPKGELALKLHPKVSIEIIEDGEEKKLLVKVVSPDNVEDRALWGLFRALIENNMVGVTSGYRKQLEINGVGYRVAQTGNKLKLEVGFSHPVDFSVPEGVKLSVEKNIITIDGIDKQLVGEVAAQIRRIKPPEPYKGKGIKYSDEIIRRKAGKAMKGASAG